jgi:CspA family cold shock protein
MVRLVEPPVSDVKEHIMVFRDQKLVCEKCGETFFFTVTEQRRLAKELGTDAVEPPELCPTCRQEPRPVSRPRPEAASPRRERRVPERRKRAQKPVTAGQATPVDVSDEFPLEEEGVEVKLIGTVKWFSREKGYGFITKADGQDLFFHRADIADRQSGWPSENQRVEFQIRQTPKGPEAFNVSVLPPA